ncbi:3'(2'),5'-bisphosphate nucleotidase CysQ [Aquicoccus sp. SCR17]|nr:3'(2'),5'-bisphosphate nucleotidase CysQ [Carideicomes alvinocaridis]
MPARDLELLLEAAQRAAEVATAHVGGPMEITDKPDDAGPVTQADIAVNAVLENLLRPARPDYGWLSEESPDSAARRDARRAFIIDPIDGTRSFIDGKDSWAHSIAVAEEGEVTAAVVYLPMLDRLFAAAKGHGATLNGEPIRASETGTLAEAEILTTQGNMHQVHWPRAVPGFRRAYRPSLAYRMSLVAQGRYDAMLTFRQSWEWDIAAGALICAEAGATVTDRAGRPLRFNNADPKVDGVVAAGARIHDALMAELRD